MPLLAYIPIHFHFGLCRCCSLLFILFYIVRRAQSQLEYASSSVFSKSKPYYMAGVVEYAPDPGGIGPNVNRFMSIIEGDEAKDVDILVFPEFSLNNVSTPIEVPNAKDMIRPCGQQKYSDVMESLSCSANRARKYVVINVTTKLNCTEDATVSCPEWGYHMYNTAVVFNRNGIVVAT